MRAEQVLAWGRHGRSGAKIANVVTGGSRRAPNCGNGSLSCGCRFMANGSLLHDYACVCLVFAVYSGADLHAAWFPCNAEAANRNKRITMRARSEQKMPLHRKLPLAGRCRAVASRRSPSAGRSRPATRLSSGNPPPIKCLRARLLLVQLLARAVVFVPRQMCFCPCRSAFPLSAAAVGWRLFHDVHVGLRWSMFLSTCRTR